MDDLFPIQPSFPQQGAANRYWFDVCHKAPRPAHGARVKALALSCYRGQKGERSIRYFVAQEVYGTVQLLTIDNKGALSWEPQRKDEAHG